MVSKKPTPKKIRISEDRILVNKIILATTEVAATQLLELLKRKLVKR